MSLHAVAFQPALALGGALTAVAALAHVGCVVFGAPWYRFFGAGERMARMADAGDPMAAIITATIAAALMFCALCAFSASGLLPRIPMRAWVLAVFSGILLLRALSGIAVAMFVAHTEQGTAFWWWSSAICLGLGLIHVWGLSRAWAHL